MTVLLLDMLLIWRSWQKAGRQRGRASGVLTQSQETGSTCHPVPAWGPATISLHLHIPSAHEGAEGRAPSPAPACAASLGFYLRTRSPSGSHWAGCVFSSAAPTPLPLSLQSRFPPCDPIFSQWCSVLWLVVLCAWFEFGDFFLSPTHRFPSLFQKMWSLNFWLPASLEGMARRTEGRRRWMSPPVSSCRFLSCFVCSFCLKRCCWWPLTWTSRELRLERRLERRNWLGSTVQSTFIELPGPVCAGAAEGRGWAQDWRRPHTGGRDRKAWKSPSSWLSAPTGLLVGPRQGKQGRPGSQPGPGGVTEMASWKM